MFIAVFTFVKFFKFQIVLSSIYSNLDISVYNIVLSLSLFHFLWLSFSLRSTVARRSQFDSIFLASIRARFSPFRNMTRSPQID